MTEQGIMLDHTIQLVTTNSTLLPNPYGSSLTDLSALFNQRVAAVLKSPDTYTNTTGYDNGASKHVINTKGWNIQVDYTAEGSWGFTPIALLSYGRRDSGASYSRMYYAYNYEPAYQLICRREQDQYFTSYTLKWDENNLIGYMNIRALDSSYAYAFIFQIERSTYNLKELLFRNTAAWTSGPNFMYGYKHYDRTISKWSPISVVLTGAGGYSDIYIKYTSIDVTNITIENPISNSLYNTIKYDNAYPEYTINTPIINNVTKYNITVNTNINLHINNQIISTYEYSFFVEGREDDVLVEVTSIANADNKYAVVLKENETFNAARSVYGDYIIRSIDNKLNYSKIIKINEPPMVKGSITGTITLKSCQVNPENLYVMCLRSDGQKIGEYQVSSTNTYRIHNLNIHDRYHIILIDKARTLEWMVSSYRKPMPYDDYIEIDTVEPINGYIITDGTLKILKWNFDLSEVELSQVKVNYINIYYGDTIINNNLIPLGYIMTYGKSIDLTSHYLNNFKYYIIETVYRNKTKKSNIITNDALVNIAKFTSEYND